MRYDFKTVSRCHSPVPDKYKAKSPVRIGHYTQQIQEIYRLEFKLFIGLIPYAHTYFHYIYRHDSPVMANHGIRKIMPMRYFHPTRCRLSSRILSAIIAMNSLFVGFPLRLWMVYPK